MWVQINLCLGDRAGELLDAIRCLAFRRFVRKVLGAVVGGSQPLESVMFTLCPIPRYRSA